MKIQPTENGGRIINGSTPYGSWEFLISPKGTLVSHEFSFGEPSNTNKVVEFTKNIVKHRTKMAASASEPVIRDRIACCCKCESFDATRFICKTCGCRWKTKLRTKANSCPENVWAE